LIFNNLAQVFYTKNYSSAFGMAILYCNK